MAAYTTIDDAGSFFNINTWSGTGSSRAFTGIGFQPDFVWVKKSNNAAHHCLEDAVRGAEEMIQSSSLDAEVTRAGGLTSFDSDGWAMSVGDDGDFNGTGSDFVGWNWKAGTTTGIAGSPSITPTSYSFNATSGFSIIKYVGIDTAGATIPHGLGVAPNMVIIKDLDNANDWAVYTSALGATKYLLLNTAAAAGTATSLWNDTEPTSTLVSLGTTSKVNYDPRNYVAYCFTNIQGYSRFGSYTGNGNADGPFVYTGFRPAFVMLKCSTRAGTDDWPMFDDRRLGYNVDNNALVADDTDAERTQDDIDILSNGFKCRNSVTDVNANGDTMVYMAFAESPFCNSSGVPANAR